MKQKSAGQQAYERDLQVMPNYPHNNTPRPQWDRLNEIARWSWDRNPTDPLRAIPNR